MFSKHGLAVMVGALLLAAPSALALPLQVPGETQPTDGLLDTDVVEPVLEADAPVPVDAAPVPDAVAEVAGLLECRMAVRVPVAILWGDVTDHRTQSLDLALTRSVETVVETARVPVYGTVEEVVWEPAGLLGFLEPVTREVRSVTGYDVETVTELTDLDIDVHLEFEADYRDYDGAQFPIQLALPVGLDFLRDGVGDLVTVCDGSVVHAIVPSFPDRAGHDLYTVCIGCTLNDPDAYDGWYVRVLSATPSLAGPDSDAVPYGEHRGLLFGAGDLLKAADLAADRFADEYEGGDATGAEVDGSSTDIGTDAAEATAVQASVGTVFAVGAAGLLGLLGLTGAGLVALRRFR